MHEHRNQRSTYTVRGTPSHVPDPRSTRSWEMPTMIGWLSVYQMTTPESIAATPRVTISEFTPIFDTVVPVTIPIAAPTARPPSTATTTGAPSLAMKPAVRTCDSPATGPTAKSNWPRTSGIMIASARMPTTDWLPSTFLTLAAVAKVSEV